MKFKKTVSFIAAAVLVLGLAIGANAGAWVGPYGGVNFGTSQDIRVNAPFVNGTTLYGAKVRTGFGAGLSVGYDFVNGSYGPTFPDWMKYFGVQMDIGYNQSNFSAQNLGTSNFGNRGFSNVDGGNTSLSFMLVGRYPLMITDEYKNGRFGPYVGVGPTLRFSSYNFSNYGGSNSTATNVGLVTEAGIRYMVTPNFSAGLAYRYTYLPGSVDVSLPGVGNANFAGTQNSHSGIIRLNYHF